MKPFWRKLARVFISAAATGVAVSTTGGEAITSGNVLFPSLVAGGIATIHAILPPRQPEPPAEPPSSLTSPPR